MFVLFFQSCTFSVENIKIGKAQCHFCKMTISDARFGGALLTQKGKTYHFDDMFCLQSFISNEMVHKIDIRQLYIQNYDGTNELIEVQKAYLIESKNINGPMNGHWIGFKSKESYFPFAKTMNGKEVQENIFR